MSDEEKAKKEPKNSKTKRLKIFKVEVEKTNISNNKKDTLILAVILSYEDTLFWEQVNKRSYPTLLMSIGYST